MLGNYLKKYRIKHNLSQKEMAEKLGTDQTYYSRIETEKAKPGHSMIHRISTAIGVSSSYISKLVYGDNKQTESTRIIH